MIENGYADLEQGGVILDNICWLCLTLLYFCWIVSIYKIYWNGMFTFPFYFLVTKFLHEKFSSYF